MRTTLDLALLLTLVLLANAGFVPFSDSTMPSDSGNEPNDSPPDHTDPPEHPESPNAATVLTPTIFTASHDSVFWSALALTGVAWVMYGA